MEQFIRFDYVRVQKSPTLSKRWPGTGRVEQRALWSPPAPMSPVCQPHLLCATGTGCGIVGAFVAMSSSSRAPSQGPMAAQSEMMSDYSDLEQMPW
jgi:hypothetical protein